MGKQRNRSNQKPLQNGKELDAEPCFLPIIALMGLWGAGRAARKGFGGMGAGYGTGKGGYGWPGMGAGMGHGAGMGGMGYGWPGMGAGMGSMGYGAGMGGYGWPGMGGMGRGRFFF